jgi:hypothetical protein
MLFRNSADFSSDITTSLRFVGANDSIAGLERDKNKVKPCSMTYLRNGQGLKYLELRTKIGSLKKSVSLIKPPFDGG